MFIERLAALVSVPRVHLQTYHGVLAPSASWRDDVVVGGKQPRRGGCPDAEQKGDARSRPPHRYRWAELLRRVFGLDVLCCNRCHAKCRLVSLITSRLTIVRILAHLGLETDPPPIQPARAPPQLEFGF